MEKLEPGLYKNDNLIKTWSELLFNNEIIISIDDDFSYGKITRADSDLVGKLVLPDIITQIDDEAFRGCKKLSEIILPQTLKSIGYGTFSECNFEKIYIPNSVSKIGLHAFWNCMNLKVVNIPNSVSFIGISTFAYCSKLEQIIVTSPNILKNNLDFADAYEDKIKIITIDDLLKQNKSFKETNKIFNTKEIIDETWTL